MSLFVAHKIQGADHLGGGRRLIPAFFCNSAVFVVKLIMNAFARKFQGVFFFVFRSGFSVLCFFFVVLVLPQKTPVCFLGYKNILSKIKNVDGGIVLFWRISTEGVSAVFMLHNNHVQNSTPHNTFLTKVAQWTVSGFCAFFLSEKQVFSTHKKIYLCTGIKTCQFPPPPFFTSHWYPRLGKFFRTQNTVFQAQKC